MALTDLQSEVLGAITWVFLFFALTRGPRGYYRSHVYSTIAHKVPGAPNSPLVLGVGWIVMSVPVGLSGYFAWHTDETKLGLSLWGVLFAMNLLQIIAIRSWAPLFFAGSEHTILSELVAALVILCLSLVLTISQIMLIAINYSLFRTGEAALSIVFLGTYTVWLVYSIYVNTGFICKLQPAYMFLNQMNGFGNIV